MPADLADLAELSEAQHLAPYWWAGGLAAGRRVLCAGCGLGEGPALLAESGAASVDALDPSDAVVEAASGAAARPSLSYHVADTRRLPFGDGSFDLIVAFELLTQHKDDADQALALDEIRRVLDPDGVVAISWPSDGPSLEQKLRDRWSDVRLLRQGSFTATAILGDQATGRVRELDSPQVGTHVLALAGDGTLPDAVAMVALAPAAGVAEWSQCLREQERLRQEQADEIVRLEDQVRDRARLLERLAEAEAELARRPAVEAELQAADERQLRLAETIDELQRRAERGTQAENLVRAMEASPSWRLTRPLRSLKRFLR